MKPTLRLHPVALMELERICYEAWRGDGCRNVIVKSIQLKVGLAILKSAKKVQKLRARLVDAFGDERVIIANKLNKLKSEITLMLDDTEYSYLVSLIAHIAYDDISSLQQAGLMEILNQSRASYDTGKFITN